MHDPTAPLSTDDPIARSRAIEALVFDAPVLAFQEKMGSRAMYKRRVEKGAWRGAIDANAAAFIAQRDSFYLATASADGQPYMQHRGGPPGFLRVLDVNHLGFADFSGNKQYISAGHLIVNPKVHLFLMDYPNRVRLKIWGEAQIIEKDPDLLTALTPADYEATIERGFVIKVTALDFNCPQHITQRFTLADIEIAQAAMRAKLDELAMDNARLRGMLAGKGIDPDGG